MFKKLFFFFLLLNIAVCAKSQQPDILHYRFAITLSDANDSIHGKADVLVKFLQPTQSFSFDLANIEKGKGMHLISATGNIPLKAEHKNNKIVFTLQQQVRQNDTTTLHIIYTGIPADGLIISKNKFNHRTFFSDNWPDRAHSWLPCIDDPADKASVEFIVAAPAHYQVISNGLQVEETNLPGNRKLTHYKEEQQLPTKIMVIGAAEFAVNQSGMVDCIPVSSWVYPEEKQDGFYDYAQAKDILAWFIHHIGAYGYKKLANVESKTIFGGMENASAIFYSENSIDGKRTDEPLLAHEIAHQWFGNMATEKSFSHLWLSEGFATYMTILYMEDKYGKDTLRSMLKNDREEVIAFSKKSILPVVDTATKKYMQLLNANSYQKGGWVLHMLRSQLGDSIFMQAIRKYYATYAGKNADTQDLEKIFEKTSGKDLKTYFRQWLYVNDIPKLKITWTYNASQKKIAITVVQAQKNLLQFPLTVAVKTNDGKETKQTISIAKQKETVFISIASKPVSLILDPDTTLLFEEVH